VSGADDDAPGPIEVRWRGEREAVLWKPPGRSCELPGAAAPRSLIAQLRREWSVPEARLSHRLDRIAQGLLLVALDRERAAAHAAQFRERGVLKAYLVRVAGDPAGLVGPMRAYLRRVGRRSSVVRSGGAPASMEVLATAPAPGRRGEHHLLIRLDTGRFHQIRAMLADRGHPLVGDALYGGGECPHGPWLESAVLGFNDAGGAWRVVGGAGEPRREAIDPRMAEALGALAEAARGGWGT
jgi:23S rRNA pseudouridine1911/1915/1917 synthase